MRSLSPHAPETSVAFRVYSFLVIAATVILVWWGATVTTKGVGMAVPDWPQSYGSANPPGWWNNDPLFWEHGHRLIASLVGFLTLGMFGWRFVRKWRHGAELLGLVAVLVVIMVAIIKDAYLVASAGGALCVIWLIWSWTQRGWSLVTKLCALALMMVSLQAFLGGIRVLQISDNSGVVHGCLAQVFFCLLILIALAALPGWRLNTVVAEKHDGMLKRGAVLLVLAVSIQLILGATMRHHHRYGVASPGVLHTGESFFPGFDNFDLLILFLHKWWAVIVLIGTMTLTFRSYRPLAKIPQIRKYILLVAVMVLAQMVLGVSVIVTGKNFWVTNFHVLNGLGILALSFVFMVKCLRAQPGSILLAKRSGDVTMDAQVA